MRRDERRRAGRVRRSRERARSSCCADGAPAGNADGEHELRRVSTDDDGERRREGARDWRAKGRVGNALWAWLL
jgi:hypothetical protein